MKKAPIVVVAMRPALVFIFFACLMISTSSWADTRYISGVMTVSVRDSVNRSSKAITTVKTGDQVEVLEENGRFTRVRTKDNLEGWVSSYFLQTEAPTIDTIVRLKDEIAALKKKNDAGLLAEGGLDQNQKRSLVPALEALKTENKNLQEENQKMLRMVQEHQQAGQTPERAENDALKEKNASLQNDLDVLTKNSKNVITITKERDALASENASLRAEIAKIQTLNQGLQSRTMISWFIAGAIVFFAGLLTSKFFTRKKSKLSF
ncbi:MAG: TIGR04211 family SH3 domain-containing protein [Desulfocapsaceae bacterium]|nr:TIGR04211 family SH3 domain-containing protein [Desulfocapsaceae bacterium]